jgi:hypothetical protein
VLYLIYPNTASGNKHQETKNSLLSFLVSYQSLHTPWGSVALQEERYNRKGKDKERKGEERKGRIHSRIVILVGLQLL